METEISVFDFKRMFIGDEPVLFLLEVAFRTAFMFAFTLFLVRTVGKRGLGELSPFELLLVVALGSAVGDPMFYPDVPLLHAMVVVTVIVLGQRAVAEIVDRSQRAEHFLESTTDRLVVDGLVDVKALRHERMARDELFMLLRQSGVEQLGQVRRAYLEPSGRLSTWFFADEEIRSGLPLTPATDPDYPRIIEPGQAAATIDPLACVACGFTASSGSAIAVSSCPSCEAEDGWIPASSAKQMGTSSGRAGR